MAGNGSLRYLRPSADRSWTRAPRAACRRRDPVGRPDSQAPVDAAEVEEVRGLDRRLRPGVVAPLLEQPAPGGERVLPARRHEASWAGWERRREEAVDAALGEALE